MTLPASEPLSDQTRVTHRRCTFVCAGLFAFFFVLALALQAFGYAIKPGVNLRNDVLIPLGVILYIATPLAALAGAWAGYELFRLAAGSRQRRETKWYVWLLLFILLRTLVVFVFLQHRQRDEVILERKPPAVWKPIIYALLTAGLALFGPTRGVGDSAFYFQAVTTGTFALILADSFAVNIVACWAKDDCLEPPGSHVFQFSLRTLFFGSLAVGAYGSGLALILR